MATLTHAWADHLYKLTKKGTAPPTLTGVYLRLFTADPTAAGSFANEVAGGSYTGQNIASAMGNPTDGVGTNSSDVSFAGMPEVTVAYWGICKSEAGTIDSDEMIEVGALSAPVAVAAGTTFKVLAGDLDSTAA